MPTVAEALRTAAIKMDAVGGTGRFDATLILEYITGDDRIALVRDDDRLLTDEQLQRLEAAVVRRCSGVPIAYIIGTAGFYGRTFVVDERVLVPRPETELVVEAAVADLRGRGKTAGRVADIGTGSGAIAISIACELSDVWVFGTDISADAVSVARRNAARNFVFQECTFLHGDLAEPLVRFAPFDCIIANLPYIPTAEIPQAPNPVGFEPPVALDGGADGLDLYRRLIAQLPLVAAPDAVIFFEAAPGTIEPLASLVEAAFPDGHVEIGEDYAGLERYVQFTRSAG